MRNDSPLTEFLASEAFKSSGYLTINKALVKKVGIIAASIISNYIDKSRYFTKEFPENDGWFFFPHNQQVEQLHLGERTIIKYKKQFVESGILVSEYRGQPRKEWFKIDFESLAKFVFPVPPKRGGQDPPKRGGQDPPKRGGLRITNKENLKRNIDPKGSTISKRLTRVNRKEVDQIIDHWSNLPNGKSHKKDPESKTYQNIKSILGCMLQGLPIMHTADYQPAKILLSFANRFNINENLISDKRWTVEEICSNLDCVNEQLNSKHSLIDVLWNRFFGNGGFSHFLFVADRKNVPKVYRDMADALEETVGMKIPIGRKLDWSKEFASIVEEQSVDLEELIRVVSWYTTNHGKKYVPVASNAQEFCDKYNRIKRAMARSKSEVAQNGSSASVSSLNKYKEAAERRGDLST